MPKKQKARKKNKTKKLNKKISRKKISKKKFFEETAEKELENKIEETDKKIKEKEKKCKKKKVKKQKEGESKKIIGHFYLNHKAILVGEIFVAIVAVALTFMLLFNGNLFHWNRQQSVLPEANQSKSSVQTDQTEEKTDTFDSNSLEQDQQMELKEAKKIDSSNWATFINKYYGFELKYPPDWNKVSVKRPIRGSKWAARYQFRKKNPEEDNPYAGFDVTVYSVKTVKEIKSTEEFPVIKDGVGPNAESCQTIPGHLEENPDYPNEEIFIPLGDDCYNPTLFYTITRDGYIYNISPAYVEGFEKTEKPKEQALEKFPDFFEAAISLKLIDIVQPEPQPATPQITAPMPVSAVKDARGRLVCAKKHDRPGKSKTNHHKHLDMECCLDPDEYPNPWCYYDPGKYGKYLK